MEAIAAGPELTRLLGTTEHEFAEDRCLLGRAVEFLFTLVAPFLNSASGFSDIGHPAIDLKRPECAFKLKFLKVHDGVAIGLLAATIQ